MEQLHVQNPRSVATAGDVLMREGIILYPTDTLYGLGADALSDTAVDAIYALKGRDQNKPIHAIVASLEMAREYAEIDEVAEILARHFLPGPLTLVVPKRAGFDTGIFRDIETVGIRIPNNEFCLALARELNRPITTTSANKSNEQPQTSVAQIVEQFGKDAFNITLCIDAGAVNVTTLPSTVVDVTSKNIKILREGAILASEIAKVVPF